MSILEVKNVSIRYMTGDFKDIGLKEYVLRKLKRDYNVVEFWADKNINFTLEKGDMLGIIGTNGAGKSTLLKVVSGIMEPTKGNVKREGTIAALLELGSGFDGDLTVKENTYLRGAMLGYTRKFMDETYDQIIDFAELRPFEDRPFKHLSSGMKSRLAFSIASLVRPDILILDEVLSVGDGAFRAKSEAKMKEILSSGATTILVSHAINQVRSLCNKVLWLHKGEQIMFGDDVQGICDVYQQFLDGDPNILDAVTMTRFPSDPSLLKPPLFLDEQNTATFDIIGCPVARDIFGMHPESTQYFVKHFIQSNHPISMLSPSLMDIGDELLEPEDCVAKNSFWEKVLLTDVNKCGFSDLKESHADWLILDISEVRYNLMKVTHDQTGKSTYLTNLEPLHKSLSTARKHGKFACALKKQDTLTLDKAVFSSALQHFAARLLELYPTDRIILTEVCSVDTYLADDGFRFFENMDRRKEENELVRWCQEQMCQLLPNSYVIRLPRGLYGNPDHKWGKNPRHYDYMYYDYALKAVHVITDKEIQNKQEQLDSLWLAYSQWFLRQRLTHSVCCKETNA